VMVMTTGVAVFATDSNTGGSTTPETYAEVSGTTIVVNNPTDVIKYKMYGAKKYKKASSNVISGLKKGKKYIVKTGGKTYKLLVAKGKIKKTTVKKNKVTVKLTKRTGANSYIIRAVRVSDGKVVKKTVKKLSSTFKLAKGEWKITVTPRYGTYTGQKSVTKKVVVK